MWLLENVLLERSCTLHCIDPWDCPINALIEARLDHNIEVAGERSCAQLIKHKGRSVDVLPSFQRASVDVAYIDGSHLAGDAL